MNTKNQTSTTTTTQQPVQGQSNTPKPTANPVSNPTNHQSSQTEAKQEGAKTTDVVEKAPVRKEPRIGTRIPYVVRTEHGTGPSESKVYLEVIGHGDTHVVCAGLDGSAVLLPYPKKKKSS